MLNYVQPAAYRTKTLFAERDNGVVTKKDGSIAYPISIDIGYGGVKLYGPNIVSTFPSYAKKIDLHAFIGEFATDDILYTDLDTNETWLVGRAAQNSVRNSDTSDSIEALCGRNRYFSPMFKVLAESAYGIAMMYTKNALHYLSQATPYVISGLPCQYLEADTPFLKEILAGHHHFSIKIGNCTAYNFDFTMPECNVFVIRQPMGAFVSAATDVNWVQNVQAYANKGVLIFDPGFKTLDTFSIRGGEVDSRESWPELGMSRILSEVSQQIMSEYGMDIPPAHMQKYLETGEFSALDRKTRKAAKVDFAYILDEKSRKICQEALNKAFDMYDSFLEYDYLIVAGGTGAAWAEWIKEDLAGMQTLNVIATDTPDGFPMIFANARGYYSYLKSLLATM